MAPREPADPVQPPHVLLRGQADTRDGGTGIVSTGQNLASSLLIRQEETTGPVRSCVQH